MRGHDCIVKDATVCCSVWLGSPAVACQTSDREVAGSTPGHSTVR